MKLLFLILLFGLEAFAYHPSSSSPSSPSSPSSGYGDGNGYNRKLEKIVSNIVNNLYQVIDKYYPTLKQIIINAQNKIKDEVHTDVECGNLSTLKADVATFWNEAKQQIQQSVLSPVYNENRKWQNALKNVYGNGNVGAEVFDTVDHYIRKLNTNYFNGVNGYINAAISNINTEIDQIIELNNQVGVDVNAQAKSLINYAADKNLNLLPKAYVGIRRKNDPIIQNLYSGILMDINMYNRS